MIRIATVNDADQLDLLNNEFPYIINLVMKMIMSFIYLKG